MPFMFGPIEMSIIGFIIAIVVSIFVIIIIREIVCWYFKLNKIVTLLQSIDAKLTSPMLQDYQGINDEEKATITPGLAMKIPKGEELCPHCGHLSLIMRARCEHCGKDKR